MKIKKKLPVLVLIGFILTGCGGQTVFPFGKTPVISTEITASQMPASPTPTIRVDAGSLQGVNLTFMHPWTGDVQTAVEAMVTDFNSSNEWGIHVTTIAPGSSSALSESVWNGLQNFSPPEVIAAPIDYLLSLNQSDKVVTNLTPFMESAQWGLTEEEISYFSPVFWQQDVVNGFRYGIPAQRTAKVMIYNKTWANELGYSETPSTLEAFQQQVCGATGKLKLDSSKSNDGLGGWIIDTDGLTMASWLEAFGSDYGASGKIEFNNSKTISSFRYLRELFDNECAWLSTKPAPYAYFAQRQTLIYSADLQDLFLQKRAQGLSGSVDEWLVLPFPSSTEPFILAQGPSYAILATSDEKRLAAWLFVRWMSNVDHQGKIIKASGTLPLSEKSVQYAIELEDSLPQWNGVAGLLKYVKVPPSSAEWQDARIILEDASWQLFKTNIKVDEIPALIKSMDQTLAEISAETP